MAFQYANGKYYSSPDITIMGQPMFAPGFYSNPKMLESAIKGGWIKEIDGPKSGNTQSPTYSRESFTPNAFTQQQLAGMGAGSTPQWMMDAYTNKIQGMGGNANLPPFGITQSGFPGLGGKTAPAGGSNG